MAEFQELIKNFDRIREYMRQFYVYGFKVRGDYEEKSARTYDNERRRIESWLGNYTKFYYTSKGKQVYINVDSRTIAQNPLYAAWKSKSFTDNDLLLHFFLLELLNQCPEGKSAGSLGDEISARFGTAFDSQTIRLKLKEYEELGIVSSHKSGKSLLYALVPPLPAETDENGLFEKLLTAVKFYQEAAPFGFIGSTVLDRENRVNDLFQFKHHFIVHTLEDGILYPVLKAMEEEREIRFENKSSRSGKLSVMYGVPLKIFVSTRTGRRYACVYMPQKRRFLNVRLDCLMNVEPLAPYDGYLHLKALLQKNLSQCFGVSFGGPSRLEEICMKLFIDEETESHVLERLYREGRGGEVLKIRDHEYLYSGKFFDTNEMLSWVKTFTGRILDIQGSNREIIQKVVRDLQRMYEMYG